MTDELKIIADSNEEMLRYFKQLHADHLEKIQVIKEGLFEINIRLDELEKTKKVYSLNIDYRKNVFSPLPDENSVNEKEMELRAEMHSLIDQREDLETQLAEESGILKSLEIKLKKLDRAKEEIRGLIMEEEERQEEQEAEESFEFIREDEEQDADELLRIHGRQILLLKSFDQTYLSTVLDRRLRAELDSLSHRLTQAEGFSRVDPNRSAILIREARQGMDRIYQIVESQLKKNIVPVRESEGVRENLEDLVLSLRDKHPEIVIDAEIPDFHTTLTSLQLRELVRLCQIFLDNGCRHAEASRLTLKISESEYEVSVEIVDNGKGISPDYMMESPWYSNIHRADEILFLMGGEFNITQNYPKGTSVRFSFPINAE